jgi:hypothetical protein
MRAISPLRSAPPVDSRVVDAKPVVGCVVNLLADVAGVRNEALRLRRTDLQDTVFRGANLTVGASESLFPEPRLEHQGHSEMAPEVGLARKTSSFRHQNRSFPEVIKRNHELLNTPYLRIFTGSFTGSLFGTEANENWLRCNAILTG